MESKENLAQGLERELLEETGCKAKVTGELGFVIEYRNKIELLQLNYCYFAKVQGKPGLANFDNSEKERGFQLHWIGLSQAISNLKNSNKHVGYDTPFILKRDLVLLQKASDVLKK